VEVEHLGLERLDHLRRRLGADVELVELRVGVEVLSVARREVVDDEHLVAERQVRVDDLRGDEPSSTRDDDLHDCSSA
jgi:hypothetical protein